MPGADPERLPNRYAAEYDKYLASLIGHPQLLGLARRVLGAPIRFDHCVTLNRPGGNGGTSWHSHSYGEEDPRLGFLRIFFYVNGFEIGDGGLKVVPGSHLFRDPEIRWQPYEINPAIAGAGMEGDDYLESVFGSPEAGREILADVRDVGEGEGIRFDFDRVSKVPNTLAAHRLILLAEEQNAGEAISQALFRGFFEEGRDIGDLEVLSDVAAESGMDRVATRVYLAGDRNRDTVRARQAQAQSAGLTAVCISKDPRSL